MCAERNNHVVIMAGGVGSRFWPMSTPQCPKQFIDVLGCGKSLIRLTAERFETVCPPENVWVVTGEQYVDTVKEQLPHLPPQQILSEPCGRSTAPCIAYVARKIGLRHPEANVVITAADALVRDVQAYRRVMLAALQHTQTGNNIVTVGICPTRPETGYGYIAAGEQLPGTEILKVKSFKEKPNRDTAEEYLRQGGYYWNAGIFIWNIQTINNAMQQYAPEISHIFDRIEPHLYTEGESKALAEFFPQCPNISVDYAIMEKARDVCVIPADFEWSDLGTWGSLHEVLPKDSGHNAVVGAPTQLSDTANSIVHTESLKQVVIRGLNGYIVAEKDGRLLICKLSDEQEIRNLIP